MEQLDFLRNAGETVRFHTMPILRPQNIAEHSWHLTMLLYLMYGQTDPGITFELLMAGLTHDMAEHQTGDLPAPAKRAMDERLEIASSSSLVTFAQLSEERIRAYVDSGEPFDKAGGYAIQGLASRFIPRIDGSYSNVVGLPVERVATLLTEIRYQAGKPG